ncbi:hypothetical protein [Dictyobacter formicarum]|uniref:hypothetical protein n=1 Tax=Dictyobacter formicarum TaxID=2778368 RepID=UPI001916473E|nr:hypothetical protein [Dictyobacter formicarum]
MRHHPYRNYRIISVLFWSFPYLPWQAFGHWSGFIVGVIMAIILTTMLNNLFHTGNWNKIFTCRATIFTDRETISTRLPDRGAFLSYGATDTPERNKPATIRGNAGTVSGNAPAIVGAAFNGRLPPAAAWRPGIPAARYLVEKPVAVRGAQKRASRPGGSRLLWNVRV